MASLISTLEFIPHSIRRSCARFLMYILTILCFNMNLDIEGDHPDPCRAIVSNHTGMLDIGAFINYPGAGFVANDGVRSIPGIGKLAECLGSTFVYRGPDAERRARCKHAIKERLEALSDGSCTDPYVVFPEGTVTNGKSGMILFKSGVFQPAYESPDKVLAEVQPCVIRHRTAPGAATQSMIGISQVEWLVLTLTTPWVETSMQWLPPIKAPECPKDMSPETSAAIFAMHTWREMTEASQMDMMNGTLTASRAIDMAVREISASRSQSSNKNVKVD